MAELPRYQQTGLLPGDIPRLDMANIKESINLTRTISSNLDRLSDFAFKDAAEKAQKEGALYGAENAPTLEQIQIAKAQGKTINDLMPKPGTFFGDAARKVQAAQLRLELETRGREEVAKISGLLDTNQIDIKEAQLRITSMTNGFSRTLAQMDPQQSLAFRASIASSASDTYRKSHEKTTRIYQEGLKSNAERMIADTSTLLSDSLRYEADPKMLADKFDIQYKRVFDVAFATNDPQFVADQMKAFEAKRLNSIVDYIVSPEFAANPVDGFRKITSKDYGKLSEVMKTVDVDRLKKQYIERSADIEKSFKAASTLNASINIDKVADIKDEVYSGKISGTVGANRIKALGVTLLESERQSMLSGDFAGATPQMYGRYESIVENGRLGEEDLDKMGGKELSWKQVNELKRKARNNEPEMSAANRYIDASLGVPDPFTPGFGTERKRSAEAKAMLLTAREDARSQGLPFNPMSVARDNVKKIQETADFKQSQENIDLFKNRLAENNIKYDEFKIYTDEDLKKAGVTSSNRTRILNAQKLVRGSSND
jgi:hypothetical protein